MDNVTNEAAVHTIQQREADAWRRIAERIELGLWEYSGLCHEALIETSNNGLPPVDEAVQDRMLSRIRAHLRPEQPWAFPLPCAAERILAAYLLALEAEQEA